MDTRVDIDDYTVLVGPNGAGKSSIIYALNWFFNGGTVEDVDLFKSDPEEVGCVAVQVGFDRLSAEDELELGALALDGKAVITRMWDPGKGERLLGKALTNPSFEEVKTLAPAEGKVRYNELIGKGYDLPNWKNKDQAYGALDRWASDPDNKSKLTVSDVDASSLLHRRNGALMKDLIEMFLVPAVMDIATQVGSDGKNSILGQLLSLPIQEAVGSAQSQWELENADALYNLKVSIENAASETISVRAGQINHHLKQLIPSAEMSLLADPLDGFLRDARPSVRAEVAIDGRQFGVGQRGHGTQRALLIAAIQALLEDDSSPAHPDKSGQNLILAIEEPEIYQHPGRSRHFSTVLQELGNLSNSQVVLASHSPYFVPPSRFESLRRLTAPTGESQCWRATAMGIASRSTDETTAHDIETFFEREIPSSFAEGFFADLAVLVEGETDRITLETIAEMMGRPLPALGIAVLSMSGKANLHNSFLVLNELGIPVYVVADGDADAADAKYPDDDLKREEARQSKRRATEKLLSWLPSSTALHGPLATGFDQPTSVTQNWSLFRDDLESELKKWSGFEAALKAAGSGFRRRKNVIAYRTAAKSCSVDDLPDSLRALVLAVVDATRRRA